MRRYSSSQENSDLVREGGVLPVPIPFGKYYLLEKIATGGMAEIFKAKAFGVEGFERLLAVKRILSTISADTEFISMFIDEAKIAGRLNHANIAQIFDLGKAEGSYYIALEYVSGHDARAIFERCRRNRRKLGIDMACYVTMKVCEGLDYAHNKTDTLGNPLNIVHRDVSPQNILVSYEGEVKLIDFGIAKAAGKSTTTQVGILKGKFSYMSPEQVRGLTLDRRSDIFSLSICLYEMLTSERLFLGDSDFETLERIRKVEVTPPSLYNPHIPKELEDIILKGLAKDPNARFQTTHEMQQALQKFMFNQSFHFTNKDLASAMQNLFSDELRMERRKIEYYQTLDLDTIRRQSGEAGPPSVMKGTGSSLDWDEDEVPTTVWDRPDDRDSDLGQVINDFDFGDGDDWTHDPDTAVDNLPPPPVMAQTDPHTLQSEEYQDAWDRILGSKDELPAVERESSAAAAARPVPYPAGPLYTPRTRQRSMIPLLILLVVVALGLGAGGAFLLFFNKADIELMFETQPAEVQILLDDQIIYDGQTPFTYRDAEEGVHTLTVLADGYEPKSREVELRRGVPYSITWALSPQPTTPAAIRINTNPAGALVWIDDVDTGQMTPTDIRDVQRGQHTLRLVKEGYHDVEEDIRVDDELVLVDRDLFIDQYRMVLEVQPANARFWLNDGNTGTEIASGIVTDEIPLLEGRKNYLLIVEAENHRREAQIIEPSSLPELVVRLELQATEESEAEPSQEIAEVDPQVRIPAGNQEDTEALAQQERELAERDRQAREDAEREERERQAREEAEREERERQARQDRRREERERQARQDRRRETEEDRQAAVEQPTSESEQPTGDETEQPEPVALAPGRLSVGSRPVTRVSVDGEDLGFSPILHHELPPGEYDVHLVNDEFGVDYHETVRIRSGQEERVIFRVD